MDNKEKENGTLENEQNGLMNDIIMKSLLKSVFYILFKNNNIPVLYNND